jgi:hypothetical protein
MKLSRIFWAVILCGGTLVLCLGFGLPAWAHIFANNARSGFFGEIELSVLFVVSWLVVFVMLGMLAYRIIRYGLRGEP